MGALPTQDPTLLSSRTGVPLTLCESQTHVGDETQSESEGSIPGGKKSITIMNFITFLVGKKKSLNLTNVSVSTFQRNRTGRPISMLYLLYIYKYI